MYIYLMKEYSLDKTSVEFQTLKEAEMQSVFDKNIPVSERLKMSFNLTCLIFGIKEGDPLKVDKTVFEARKFPR